MMLAHKAGREKNEQLEALREEFHTRLAEQEE
jgi:hypothetical protein